MEESKLLNVQLSTNQNDGETAAEVGQEPENSESISSALNVTEILEIAFWVCVWYGSSAFTANVNKTILADDVLPFPYSLTIWHFGMNAFCCFLFVKFSSEYELQPVNMNFAKLVIPLCASQIVAHLLTQISLQHVTVSFTHTVKGTSPIFAMILSKYYYKFNEQYSITVFVAVFTIIGGVVLSSLNELSFNLVGFITALCSTLVFCWQNAFSKNIFHSKEMDHINLLFYTSSFAFVMMIPLWFIYDLPHLLKYKAPADMVLSLYLMSGVGQFGQNISAFTFMTKVMPLTYTIFNTFKRTFVIVVSILWFQNPINSYNAIGIILTTVGVGLYNKAKLDMRTNK